MATAQPTHKIAYGPVPIVTRRGGEPETLYRTYVIESARPSAATSIIDASVVFDQQTNQPEVNVKLDRVGADLFEQDERRQHRPQDGHRPRRPEVRSDPIFNERIPGGSVRITLGATPGRAFARPPTTWSRCSRAARFPARLQKEFEIRVGADLGKDSVERGFKAFVYGLDRGHHLHAHLLPGSGIIAVIALVLNMVLILAAMALFGATLTLPASRGSC